MLIQPYASMVYSGKKKLILGFFSLSECKNQGCYINLNKYIRGYLSLWQKKFRRSVFVFEAFSTLSLSNLSLRKSWLFQRFANRTSPANRAIESCILKLGNMLFDF